MKPRQAHRELLAVGYQFDREGHGGHRIYRRPGTPGIVVLSWHNHGKDLTKSMEEAIRKALRAARQKP